MKQQTFRRCKNLKVTKQLKDCELSEVQSFFLLNALVIAGYRM
jgi:hypothetical protein